MALYSPQNRGCVLTCPGRCGIGRAWEYTYNVGTDFSAGNGVIDDHGEGGGIWITRIGPGLNEREVGIRFNAALGRGMRSEGLGRAD